MTTSIKNWNLRSAPRPMPCRALHSTTPMRTNSQGFYVPWKAAQVARPALVKFNRELAEELGLDSGALESEHDARIFSGNETPEGAVPLAQVYAGHSSAASCPARRRTRAAVGRADRRNGRRRDIQLKGVGARRRSPRRGDGRAALGPMLREYIISEAMHALGIPTTRESRRGDDRRAGLSRDGCSRRGAHARRGEPHPRRHLAVRRGAR